MSGRDAVAMSQAEVAAFLADHLKVQVATVGAEGTPHLSTLFYVLDQGRIAFWTYGRSQKVVNLRRDPRVSALVEDGTAYNELRGVSISGRASLVTDVDAVADIGRRVARAMTGLDDGDLGDEGEALVARQASKRVGVIVEPDRVASWDHAKLA